MPLNILGKIDLPEVIRRPEEYKDLLGTKMRDIKDNVNSGLNVDFLDEGARIKMNENPDLESDKKFINEREQEWSSELHKSVEQWRRDRDRNPASITEMAVTLLLHKWLGDRFIVARASVYDDYRYGVDNVLIDKVTGAAVCGFDEVLGYNGDDGGEHKDKKIKDTILNGGSSLKYGAMVVDHELKRQDLRSMPTFYLSLSKTELNGLLSGFKRSNEKNDIEKNIMIKLVASLDNQYKDAKAIATSYFLKKNLENFAGSLKDINNKINQ